MATSTAMAGPGPSSAAFRARVQHQASEHVVPGHFPPSLSPSRDVMVDELQPPVEIIFVMGIAGYLVSLFYMLPCASSYLPKAFSLPRRRRGRVPRALTATATVTAVASTAPPLVRHVTFSSLSSPTPSISAGTSPESVSLPLPQAEGSGRKRGLSFGIRRRSSKDDSVTVTSSPPISPRSSISFSRSASPELGVADKDKDKKASLKARCSKMLHLPLPPAASERLNHGPHLWRRSTSSSVATTATLVSTDDDEPKSVPATASSGSHFLANLRKKRSNSIDICPIASAAATRRKERDEARGRTNPYEFMGSDAALPDYERRRREREK